MNVIWIYYPLLSLLLPLPFSANNLFIAGFYCVNVCWRCACEFLSPGKDFQRNNSVIGIPCASFSVMPQLQTWTHIHNWASGCKCALEIRTFARNTGCDLYPKIPMRTSHTIVFNPLIQLVVCYPKKMCIHRSLWWRQIAVEMFRSSYFSAWIHDWIRKYPRRLTTQQTPHHALRSDGSLPKHHRHVMEIPSAIVLYCTVTIHFWKPRSLNTHFRAHYPTASICPWSRNHNVSLLQHACAPWASCSIPNHWSINASPQLLSDRRYRSDADMYQLLLCTNRTSGLYVLIISGNIKQKIIKLWFNGKVLFAGHFISFRKTRNIPLHDLHYLFWRTHFHEGFPECIRRIWKPILRHMIIYMGIIRCNRPKCRPCRIIAALCGRKNVVSLDKSESTSILCARIRRKDIICNTPCLSDNNQFVYWHAPDRWLTNGTNALYSAAIRQRALYANFTKRLKILVY